MGGEQVSVILSGSYLFGLHKFDVHKYVTVVSHILLIADYCCALYCKTNANDTCHV